MIGGVAAGATVLGLYFLGFTSVFREGFETVLFLQALQLESGTPIVLAGVTLGLLGVAAIGTLTFKLEQKLPYKRMLIVTGVLMSLVLVVMVGNTLRTLQGVGWLSITPIDVEFPLWMGTWLGSLPDLGDDRRPDRRVRLRDRQLLRGRVGPQAPRAPRTRQCEGRARFRRRGRARPGRGQRQRPLSPQRQQCSTADRHLAATTAD